MPKAITPKPYTRQPNAVVVFAAVMFFQPGYSNIVPSASSLEVASSARSNNRRRIEVASNMLQRNRGPDEAQRNRIG
jgi:hypothetical protein